MFQHFYNKLVNSFYKCMLTSYQFNDPVNESAMNESGQSGKGSTGSTWKPPFGPCPPKQP